VVLHILPRYHTLALAHTHTHTHTHMHAQKEAVGRQRAREVRVEVLEFLFGWAVHMNSCAISEIEINMYVDHSDEGATMLMRSMRHMT
jgi:hypothetical protein